MPIATGGHGIRMSPLGLPPVVEANKSPAAQLEQFKFTAKQAEFCRLALCGQFNYGLFGGGIRGGKSFGLLGTFIILCRIFPGSRWAIVRTDRPTLKKTTLVTYQKVKPDGFEIDFNHTDLIATFSNGSQIMFFPESYAEDPDLNRFKGLEVNGFGLEEGNELQRATWDKAIERAGSWIIPATQENPAPKQPHPLVLVTCNPAQCYLKELFYDKSMSKKLEAPWFYLPALLTDNPHIPQAYIESLKNMDPGAYRRFVLGSWDAADDINQLIPWEDVYRAEPYIAEPPPPEPIEEDSPAHVRMSYVKECADHEVSLIDHTRKCLGVDVGRMGKDASVIKMMEGPNFTKTWRFKKTRSFELADKVSEIMKSEGIRPEDVGIDAGGGYGGGVIDDLYKLGIDVYEYVPGGKAIKTSHDKEYQFVNIRAQSYWQFKRSLAEGDVGNLMDEKTRQDITAPRYKFVREKAIQLEDKDAVKLRIGRSPDDGDAAVICNWVRCLPKIKSEPGMVVF